MKRPAPTVYVGIVTYNSAHLMEKCLAALSRQTYNNIRITVLDNHSSDGIEDVLKRHPHVRFIKNTMNSGFGSGHNRILRLVKPACTEYYVSLNPDAILTPTYIERLVRGCARYHAGWAVGKMYKDRAKKILYSVGHAMFRDGYAFNIGYGIRDAGQYQTPRQVFGAPAAAALYTGTLIQQVSRGEAFFDPRLFLYYEDVDMDWRANLGGFTCRYEPTAVAIHHGGTPPEHLTGIILGNRYLMIMKNAFLIDLIAYNIPTMLVHVLGRLFLTPVVGFRMIWLLARRAPLVMWSRTKPRVSRDVMSRWFRNAVEEKTTQPKYIYERIRAFITKH